MMIQKNQFLVKKKDVTGGVVIKEFVGLKLKMYLILVEVIVNIKKQKGLNKNVSASISHNE